MTPTQLEQTLLNKFRQLPEPFQLVVFNLLDSLLDLPSDSPQHDGQSLLRLAGTLPDDDARELSDAIDEGRQIDRNEW
ncbi:MAG: hypothetical protein ACLFM4_05310 [Phormidium sp.]|nr:MAG: hypothetical protein HLUCCO16_16065 [Phormidium sp. OSCR]